MASSVNLTYSHAGKMAHIAASQHMLLVHGERYIQICVGGVKCLIVNNFHVLICEESVYLMH